MLLADYQISAAKKMKNGCILNGGVGSGKSRTSLYYYFTKYGGLIGDQIYVPMHNAPPLYIITTARKRDTNDWEGEMLPFIINPDTVVVDSWNNIAKYSKVTGAFFIFDEQRVCGSGVWIRHFLKIAKNNSWIILSATPGDTWTDYIPVFMANKFYKTRKEFMQAHVVYCRFTKYPKIDRYTNVGKLITLRDSILISMDYQLATKKLKTNIPVDYDKHLYSRVFKDRWNIYSEKPIKNASEYCSLLRKVVNSDESRQVALLELFEKHPKMIVFYNYNYELDILRNICKASDINYAEWNGHNHQPIPETESWAYLVQYTAGAEGWNCIKTDTTCFFSLNYSYKIMAQSEGRIDRLNTPFKTLYYYYLKSSSSIDLAVGRALSNKKRFNENKFAGFEESE